MMRDVLIVTGPVNSSQLGIYDADYHVIHIHPKGDIGSNAMYSFTNTWLKSMDLRSRLEQELGHIENIGIIWFSAGHGSVRAILETTDIKDVSAWMCIDGLYGRNDWAINVTKEAMVNNTSLLATASKSTPGHYDHSLDRWIDVVERNQLPKLSKDRAEEFGLPSPDYCWGTDSCIITGYDDIGHAKQVPEMRTGMLNFWNVNRASPTPPLPSIPPSIPPPTNPFPTGIVIASVGVIGVLLYLAKKV